MKKILFLTIFITTVYFTNQIIAQTVSNQVNTKVGNPTGTPPGEGPLGFKITCPLDPIDNRNFSTSCGTYSYPSSNGCGHGLPEPPAPKGLGYQSCSQPPYAECGPLDSNGFRQHGDFLKKSADIIVSGGNSSNKPVYMPFINGNEAVNWTKIEGPTPISGGSWGYKFLFTTNYNGKTILLDFTHLNQAQTKGGNTFRSGEQFGTLFPSGRWGGAHLHEGVKVDNVAVEVQKDAFMCSS